MGVVSFLFEALSLLAFFAAFSTWSFKYVFNHDIIRNYAHRKHYPKSQINSIIELKMNRAYNCKLLHLDTDDENDDEDGAKIPTQNAAISHTYVPFSSPLPASESTFGDSVNWAKNGHISQNQSFSNSSRVHYVVGVLFSTVVTLLCELILLLMIQLFGSAKLNLVVFRLVIRVLVVLVTLIQPPLVVYLFVNQKKPGFRLKLPAAVLKTGVTCILCGVWFVILGRFGAIAQELGSNSGKSFLERKTNEIVLAGISITAILSGVGCTLTPIQSFWIDGISAAKTLGKASGLEEVQLNELIQSYNLTKMLTRKRQVELNTLLLNNGGKVYNAPEADTVRLLRGSGRQFLNRVQSFTSISNITGSASEEDELTREIALLKGLQGLIYADLSKKLASFLRHKEHAPRARRRLTRCVAICNWLFLLYCIYRIVNVLCVRLPYHYFWSTTDLHRETNIIDDKESSAALNKNTKDALAITIAKIIQGLFGYLPMSETQLINQVSFILSGSLFVCSFQNVLVTFKSLGRFLPTHAAAVNANVKTWIKHLIVSEFLAIYVIATALLIRLNLPPEIASLMLKILSLSPHLGTTSQAQMLSEVEFIDTWFDKVFGVSCVVTFLVIAMKLFIENDSIYEGGYDEEMIIEDNSGLKRS